MIDWEKYLEALDSHERIVNKLSKMSDEGFYRLPSGTRKAIFNPLNIFYIQRRAGNTRGTYKVYLDAPVEVTDEKQKLVDSYQIKAGSLDKIRELLGDRFRVIRQDLICSLDRIRGIDKDAEIITLRRIVLSESQRINFYE